MSRNNKILIGALLGLIVVCACSTIVLYGLVQVGRNVSVATDPKGSAAVAASIADYDLPPGYREGLAAKILGLSFVTLESERAGNDIFLMQFPADEKLDQKEMEAQLRQALQGRSTTGSLKLTPVGGSTATIRGQEVRLVISEGTNQNGYPFRQVTGVFQGKNGPVMLMVVGPTSTWDQAALDAFLASIR